MTYFLLFWDMGCDYAAERLKELASTHQWVPSPSAFKLDLIRLMFFTALLLINFAKLLFDDESFYLLKVSEQ